MCFRENYKTRTGFSFTQVKKITWKPHKTPFLWFKNSSLLKHFGDSDCPLECFHDLECPFEHFHDLECPVEHFTDSECPVEHFEELECPSEQFDYS